ncbi:hypothetical protein GCM10009795_048850 [Nocardioides hankookensis]|uniref:DUF6461 domain-containing protein n=1 Tax=Nocardioides hankookensis TaxID=443157 RepID=A0ABW1LEC0_9ACTN
MPAVDVETYAWLSESELEVAGCVTVVPEADPDAVVQAFGHEPGADDGADGLPRESFSERAIRGDLGDFGNEIWVAATGSNAAVFEFNGFEGTRAEVLRDASRRGAKVAASIFWNVNGAVQVTCARRGKVVATVDLSYVDEDDLAELPRALRPLARLCVGDDVPDLVAVGAAMVETYAGVGFSRADLDGSRSLPIISRPADLTTYLPGGRGYRPLEHSLPELQDAVDALPPGSQRRLAEWAALAAAREAGLTDQPAVRQVLDQLGSGAPTSLPPGLETLRRRYAAASDRLEAEDDFDEASAGALARYHAWLPIHGLEALRYTSHADPYSAAIGALSATASAFTSTRTERGATFVNDERGRHVGEFAPSPRMRQLANVLGSVLAADPTDWDELAARLPAPLGADELAAAADADRRWQEAGAFATWQFVESHDHESDDDDDDDEDGLSVRLGFGFVEPDYDASVLERYRELDQRDRAIAARGPIAAGVLEPDNPGGFAVVMSDGVQIERMPVGRKAGYLWFTFVWTSEFGIDPWMPGGRGQGPDDRVRFDGPYGRIHPNGGGGSGDGDAYSWHFRIPIAGLAWVRLTYVDDRTTVATETINLA